jgi:carbonic anhydrase
MTFQSRRQLLCGLACGCVAAASPFAAYPAFSAAEHGKTDVTADQAIELLKEGNAAFLKGSCTVTPTSRIQELAKGQAPFAVIVGCSDSRTPPTDVFNRGVGDLFIVRVAGNSVDSVGLGSIEYGVGVLGAPLVLVLGHTNCGAVEAAVKVVKNGAKFPGSIGTMVAPIVPAVKSLKGDEDLVNRAVRANVERVVKRLQISKPILSKAVAEKKARVVGGIYRLDTGAVEFLT